MDPENLGKILEGISGRILDYATVLAAVGVLAMALLELIKGLLRLRRFYHATQVRKWMEDDSAYRSLLALAVGGEHNAGALFDQSTSKMMGQIQAAVNIALEFPESYPEFFRHITRVPGQAGVETDIQSWRAYSSRAVKGDLSNENTADQQVIREGTQARARLDHLVARKLDAFQNATEYRWALINQVISVLLGTMILWYALAGTGAPKAAYAVAVMGGLVAPFAKDVVSALSGFKATRK